MGLRLPSPVHTAHTHGQRSQVTPAAGLTRVARSGYPPPTQKEYSDACLPRLLLVQLPARPCGDGTHVRNTASCTRLWPGPVVSSHVIRSLQRVAVPLLPSSEQGKQSAFGRVEG